MRAVERKQNVGLMRKGHKRSKLEVAPLPKLFSRQSSTTLPTFMLVRKNPQLIHKSALLHVSWVMFLPIGTFVDQSGYQFSIMRLSVVVNNSLEG